MTREELLARLGGLRQARVGQVRVPHKPLLLLAGADAGNGALATHVRARVFCNIAVPGAYLALAAASAALAIAR